MTEEVVAFVTVPDRAQADRIAETLVGEQLAACVNILGPIHSVYRWEGKVTRDEELLLVIKTTRGGYPALEARVLEIHSYDTPEVIALPIEAGSEAYRRWIREAVKTESRS